MRQYCVCLTAEVTGLVSVHDSTWTTARGGAALRWAAIDPSFGNGVDQLFRWSESLDAPSRSELSRALDGIVADVVAAFVGRIGLWE